MSYELGVDLGTTFSTVAIVRHGHGDGGGRVEMVDVGTRSFGVPSVLYIGPDGRVLVGEAAQRRAASDPDLVVREVKRRLGDTAPLLVGEVPYSPTLLTGALLRGVVSQVLRAEGEAPTRIMLAHPANWGPFRRDVFAEAASLAGLEVTFEFVTEPVAAALWHAHQERVAPGTVVAVYDLGGGTFDAAVLRKTERGFELLGEPLGLDRLGGIDFDEAIVGFVDSCLGGALRALDPSSDASARTMRAVRQEVVAAKEALSTDIAASISVPLPSGLDAVRITRREFEAMVEPQIRQSIEVMRAAIELAGVGLDQISNVLLVGGSSRIPLVAELLQRELEVSVALDSHPKNVVALGAALALLPNPEADEPTTSPPAVPPSTDHPAPPAASVAASAPAVQAAPQATVFARPPAPSASPTETFLGDVLVVATGPSGGAIIELSDADELVVGRDAAADLTLADPRVSRRHGRLFSDAGLLQLEDLGSLNHSYLDGVAVSRSVVAPGQLLRFGNSLMMAMRPESVSSLIEAGNALIAEPSMLPEPASSGGRLRRHRDNPERYRAVLNERRTDLARQAALVAAARRLQEPTAAMSLVGSRPRRDRGDSRFLHLTLGFADAPTAAPLSIPDGMGAAAPRRGGKPHRGVLARPGRSRRGGPGRRRRAAADRTDRRGARHGAPHAGPARRTATRR